MTSSAGTQRDERRRRYLAKQAKRIDAGIPLFHKNASPSRPHRRPPPHDSSHDGDEGDKHQSGSMDSTKITSTATATTEWMNQNRHLCQVVTLDDVHRIKIYRLHSEQKQTSDTTSSSGNDEPDTTARTSQSEALIHLDRLLSPYFDLQNKDLPSHTHNKYDQRLRFIAEGTETIRLLIQQQHCQKYRDDISNPNVVPWSPIIHIESLFMKPNLFFDSPVQLQTDVDALLTTRTTQEDGDDEATTATPMPPPPFQILLASMETLSTVAGFTVSRGCLACGYIPIQYNEEWFMEMVHHYMTQSSTDTATTTTNTARGTFRLLALDGISDTANLGSIIRTSSALGIHAILLSPDCCDAWYRRSVRVSMGHIFRIPMVRVKNLSNILSRLVQAPYHVTSYAAVVDATASIPLHQVNFGTLYILSWRFCFPIFDFFRSLF